MNEAGSLEYLTDTTLDADTFLEFVDRYRLGDGEAECILLAEIDNDAVVCCDDLRGRKKAIMLLGEGRLIGSLALLRMTVEGGQLDSQGAFTAYQQMRDAGGFLPELGLDYFAT
ncbi:hypothetical protein [Pelagerythrobacter sp.]|uniref:hypothetical protein n=1 Tax=Pelagerythrobacter sp. TaxID=2800702 RepID=UPI0035B3A116